MRTLAPLGYSVSFEGNFGMNILEFAYLDVTEPNGKKTAVWFVDGPSPYGAPAAIIGLKQKLDLPLIHQAQVAIFLS